jgi:uncharacterized protein
MRGNLRPRLPRVLILLPPSQSHAEAPRRGRPLDPARLSFPELAATRQQVLAALIEASTGTDAAQRFSVSERLLAQVRRNAELTRLPVLPVAQLYTGVLYDALDLAGLDPVATRRARRQVVVISALWGALRLTDRVPGYRLAMGVALPRLPALAALWRSALDPALTAAAGPRGVILDCRSSEYAAAWPPSGPLAGRTVAVRVVRDTPAGQIVVSHLAKHTRGRLARAVLASGADPRTPQQLADSLAPGWDVGLTGPPRRNQPWTLTVVEN